MVMAPLSMNQVSGPRYSIGNFNYRHSLSLLAVGAISSMGLLAVSVAVALHNTHKLHEEANWVQHTNEVLISLENILSIANNGESGVRGYAITGQPIYLDTYRAALENINKQADLIAHLTSDNPRQQARIPELRQRISSKLESMNQMIAARRDNASKEVAELMLQGQPQATLTALQATVAEMVQEEQNLLRERKRETEKTYRVAILTSSLSGLLALGATGAFILMLRRYLVAQKQSVTTIYEQAEQLQITLASIGDAVITTDTNYCIESLNAVAESLTGYESKEVVGQPLDTVFKIINEYTRQPVENPVMRALAEGVIVGLGNHTLLITKDGTERPIDDSAAPIRSQDGKIFGCVLVFRDVTERRQQERQLQEEQENLALAIDAAALGQWDLNLIDNTTHRTLRHDQIFGYESLLPEWTYKMFLEHVLPEDRPRVDATFRDALANGITWNFECRIRRADGVERWIWAKGRIRQSALGHNHRMYGVIGDITDKKQIELEIKEARSRLESTLSASEIGTWKLDFTTDTVQADRNTAQIFTVTPDEAANGPISIFMQAIHPDDQDRVSSALQQTLETGEDFKPEYRLVKPDGSERWVVSRGRLERDELGRPVMLGVVIDISAQRQAEVQLRESESRFRRIADTLPQMVWVTGADGCTEYFNHRWYEYTGCTPEESLGDNWSMLLHPGDRQKIIDCWQQSVHSGHPYEMECRFRSKEGEYRWFLGRAVSVRDETGIIVKWYGTCTDIEEFKQLEVDLHTRADQLQELNLSLLETTTLLERKNTELDQFAYVVSHDLKAPLRAISNLATWLEEDLADVLTSDNREHMQLLQSRVMRLEGLINALLDYSRIGLVNKEIETINVGDLLMEIIDTLAPPPEFEVVIASKMPAIQSKRIPLQQVLMNLINNAIKHHDRDHGTVTIRYEPQTQTFSVSDDGPGIAPEHRESIFTIFQTLRPKDQVESTGIGLAIVKKFVETEGGSIEVDSEAERGAIFRFNWPH